MTCKWGEKKNMTVLLAVGLVLLIGGLICNLFLPEEAHLPLAHCGLFQRHGRLVHGDLARRDRAPQDHRRSARQGQRTGRHR